MNSFDLTKFRNQLLAENKTVKKRILKENSDPDVIDEIRNYFEMMIQDQPEDALELIMDLVKNDGNNWGEWINNIQADIVDSYGGDYDGAIRGYREDDMEDLDEGAQVYMISKGGSKTNPHYVLEKPDGSKQIDMNFTSPEEATKYAAKKGLKVSSKKGYNMQEGTLEEMAKISGDLKSSIEAVIAANPDLQGLPLKKAIKNDINVIQALAGENLHDNQLNRFISLTKGERQNQPKGRPADPNKVTTEPSKVAAAPKEKTAKLKITTPSPQSSKLADLAPSDVFSSTGPDEEEMDMEKQATKAAKGNKRLGTTIEKLAQVTKEMKSLAKEYQAAKGTPAEAGIVAQLKDLTAEKKALEKKTAPRQMSAADLMGNED
jgi:hypothetical protein